MSCVEKHKVILYSVRFSPLLIWFRLASILIMSEAGTVMVSRVSSSITSFLLITTSACSQWKEASSAVGLQSLMS